MAAEGEGWKAYSQFPLTELNEGVYRFEKVPEGTWVLEPGVYAVSKDDGGGIVVVDEPVEAQKIARKIRENLTPSDVDEETP